MIDEKTPLRSEIADIQNSLVEGADGVILGRETSYGSFPIESISVVSKTISETENVIDPVKKFDTLYSICDYTDRDELLVMNLAKIILDKDREQIDYILTLSKDAKIPKLLAKYRLPIETLACCPDSKVVKQLNLISGVKSVKVPNYTSKLLGADHLLKIVMRTNKSMGLGKAGNWIVMFRTKDVKEGEKETENYFKFIKIS